jgi:hypothetical protein
MKVTRQGPENLGETSRHVCHRLGALERWTDHSCASTLVGTAVAIELINNIENRTREDAKNMEELVLLLTSLPHLQGP